MGLGLDILAKGKRDRSAICRIGHGAKGARQSCQQMFGPRNPVEIAADRPEAVIGRYRAVAEIFNLLQHRIRPAAGKHVSRQQQYRQAVDMCQCGCRHHVGCSGPD